MNNSRLPSSDRPGDEFRHSHQRQPRTVVPSARNLAGSSGLNRKERDSISELSRQKRVIGRVMCEFTHGEEL